MTTTMHDGFGQLMIGSGQPPPHPGPGPAIIPGGTRPVPFSLLAAQKAGGAPKFACGHSSRCSSRQGQAPAWCTSLGHLFSKSSGSSPAELPYGGPGRTGVNQEMDGTCDSASPLASLWFAPVGAAISEILQIYLLSSIRKLPTSTPGQSGGKERIRWNGLGREPGRWELTVGQVLHCRAFHTVGPFTGPGWLSNDTKTDFARGAIGWMIAARSPSMEPSGGSWRSTRAMHPFLRTLT